MTFIKNKTIEGFDACEMLVVLSLLSTFTAAAKERNYLY